MGNGNESLRKEGMSTNSLGWEMFEISSDLFFPAQLPRKIIPKKNNQTIAFFRLRVLNSRRPHAYFLDCVPLPPSFIPIWYFNALEGNKIDLLTKPINQLIPDRRVFWRIR